MMNPELRRNLWLEITPHRLVAMPVVLGLCFLALAALDKPTALQNTSLLALAGFGLIGVVWGTRLAGNSIVDEFTEKTWDWQRLSTLSPWTMAWGKLFGATAFAWYGGLICLAVFLVTARATSLPAPVEAALSLLCLALMLHAGAMAAALHTSRKRMSVNRRSFGAVILLLLIYVVPLAMARGWDSRGPVTWYGTPYASPLFTLASAAILAAWAVAGAWRAMSQSLAVRTTPWMWLAFLSFLAVYGGGFFAADMARTYPAAPTALVALLASGMGWGLLLTYAMLFSEPAGPVPVRRLLRTLRPADGRAGVPWRRVLEELPLWPVSLAFAALCAIGLAATGQAAGGGMAGWTAAPLPLVLLAARDAAILHFFSAATKPRRVEGATIVYILLLDWVIPALLHAMGLPFLADLVLPLGQGSTVIQVASAAIQAGLATWLATRRMRANFAGWRRADGGGSVPL